MVDTFNKYVQQNTWFVILMAVIASFFFPQLGFLIKPYLNALLIILMFLSCLDLKIKEIILSLTDFKTNTAVLLIVHLLSPLIIFFFRDLFSPELYLGMIIATTIPAGRSAVFLSSIYNGQPIKALVATSISNVLAPVIVPTLVWLFTHTLIKMNPFEMSFTIIYLVAIPLIMAVLFGKTTYGKKLNRYSVSISTFIVFLIILGIIAPIKSVIIADPVQAFVIGLIILFLVFLNFLAGFFFLGKTNSEKITYALSTSYKNYTLGTLLSLSLFTPLVALPSIIYTIINNLFLIFLRPVKDSQ